jgi:hypothetical protein
MKELPVLSCHLARENNISLKLDTAKKRACRSLGSDARKNMLIFSGCNLLPQESQQGSVGKIFYGFRAFDDGFKLQQHRNFNMVEAAVSTVLTNATRLQALKGKSHSTEWGAENVAKP